MTTDVMTPTPPTQVPTRSAGSLLLPIAGGALIAGSLLYAAGMATSPSAVSVEPADYIASLARDPGQTALSAMLLHYGNMRWPWPGSRPPPSSAAARGGSEPSPEPCSRRWAWSP
jgi:hypothetical protein